MAAKQREVMVKVGVSLEELVTALREMRDQDREWFLENLLAAASPEYLESIRQAREDYRQGSIVEAQELFKD